MDSPFLNIAIAILTSHRRVGRSPKPSIHSLHCTKCTLKRSARIKMIIFSSFIPYIKKSSNAKTGSVLFLHTRATWYHPADIRYMILLDGHRNSPQDLFKWESERYGWIERWIERVKERLTEIDLWSIEWEIGWPSISSTEASVLGGTSVAPFSFSCFPMFVSWLLSP